MEGSLAIESLRQCALFRDAGEGALARLASHLRQRRFRRNEVIFHQGDPGDSLHIVDEGSIKIALPSPDGEEAIIATLRQGDFFGELALLDGAPRSATAVALEATSTLALPRDAFMELLDEDRGLRDALLAGLAHELRRVTGHVEELQFLDLAGRLAMRLARLARDSDPSSDVVRLDWPYTQSDLASMIGGTRQSVNKLLSELVASGLVVLEPDALVIPSVRALVHSAER